jgi:putative NADH-flavin reductase
MTQRIAIIGASRGIGLAAVNEALTRGHAVTGLARKPPELNKPGLNWVAGDVRDPAALAQALAGVTVVVTALAAGGLGPTNLFSDAAKSITAAMEKAGIKRLIAITGFGAGDSRGHAGFMMDRIVQPLFLARMYADKDREEAIVRGTRLDWSLVRPGRLTDGPRSGHITAMTSGYRPGSISRSDVAAFVLDCIEKESYVRQAPVIVGA